MDYKNIAVTLFILIGLCNSAHIPEVSETNNEGYKQQAFNFGEYKKVKQQDPQQMRYQQQQISDSLEKKFDLRQGKSAENRDQTVAASQETSVWKVVHPKFVTEKSQEENGKKDAYQVVEIQDRQDQNLLFPSDLNSLGKAPKVLQQNLGGFVGNHQDSQLQVLNSLLGQQPNIQLQGLQQLLNTNGPVYISQKDHTPIKEDVVDIPNPQSKPNIKIQHNQEDMIKAIQALATNSATSDPDSLKSLQAQLDATASAHAEALIAEAQKKALEQVQAQHAAIAKAQVEAEKAALAQIQAQNDALSRQHAQNEARNHAEIEARKQSELESRRKSEVEARRQAELESRRNSEIEARRQADIEARRLLEREALRQVQIEASHQAENEARRQSQLEVQRQAELEALKLVENEAIRQSELQAHRQSELEAIELANIEARRQAELEAHRQSELEAKRQFENEVRKKAQLDATRKQQAEHDAQKVAAEEENKRRKSEEFRVKKEREQAKLRAKLNNKHEKAPEASETQNLYYAQSPVENLQIVKTQSPRQFVKSPVYTQAAGYDDKAPVYGQYQGDQAEVTKYYVPPQITVKEGVNKHGENEVSERVLELDANVSKDVGSGELVDLGINVYVPGIGVLDNYSNVEGVDEFVDIISNLKSSGGNSNIAENDGVKQFEKVEIGSEFSVSNNNTTKVLAGLNVMEVISVHKIDDGDRIGSKSSQNPLLNSKHKFINFNLLRGFGNKNRTNNSVQKAIFNGFGTTNRTTNFQKGILRDSMSNIEINPSLIFKSDVLPKINVNNFARIKGDLPVTNVEPNLPHNSVKNMRIENTYQSSNHELNFSSEFGKHLVSFRNNFKLNDSEYKSDHSVVDVNFHDGEGVNGFNRGKREVNLTYYFAGNAAEGFKEHSIEVNNQTNQSIVAHITQDRVMLFSPNIELNSTFVNATDLIENVDVKTTPIHKNVAVMAHVDDSSDAVQLLNQKRELEGIDANKSIKKFGFRVKNSAPNDVVLDNDGNSDVINVDNDSQLKYLFKLQLLLNATLQETGVKSLVTTKRQFNASDNAVGYAIYNDINLNINTFKHSNRNNKNSDLSNGKEIFVDVDNFNSTSEDNNKLNADLFGSGIKRKRDTSYLIPLGFGKDLGRSNKFNSHLDDDDIKKTYNVNIKRFINRNRGSDIRNDNLVKGEDVDFLIRKPEFNRENMHHPTEGKNGDSLIQRTQRTKSNIVYEGTSSHLDILLGNCLGLLIPFITKTPVFNEETSIFNIKDYETSFNKIRLNLDNDHTDTLEDGSILTHFAANSIRNTQQFNPTRLSIDFKEHFYKLNVQRLFPSRANANAIYTRLIDNLIKSPHQLNPGAYAKENTDTCIDDLIRIMQQLIPASFGGDAYDNSQRFINKLIKRTRVVNSTRFGIEADGVFSHLLNPTKTYAKKNLNRFIIDSITSTQLIHPKSFGTDIKDTLFYDQIISMDKLDPSIFNTDFNEDAHIFVKDPIRTTPQSNAMGASTDATDNSRKSIVYSTTSTQQLISGFGDNARYNPIRVIDITTRHHPLNTRLPNKIKDDGSDLQFGKEPDKTDKRKSDGNVVDLIMRKRISNASPNDGSGLQFGNLKIKKLEVKDSSNKRKSDDVVDLIMGKRMFKDNPVKTKFGPLKEDYLNSTPDEDANDKLQDIGKFKALFDNNRLASFTEISFIDNPRSKPDNERTFYDYIEGLRRRKLALATNHLNNVDYDDHTGTSNIVIFLERLRRGNRNLNVNNKRKFHEDFDKRRKINSYKNHQAIVGSETFLKKLVSSKRVIERRDRNEVDGNRRNRLLNKINDSVYANHDLTSYNEISPKKDGIKRRSYDAVEDIRRIKRAINISSTISVTHNLSSDGELFPEDVNNGKGEIERRWHVMDEDIKRTDDAAFLEVENNSHGDIKTEWQDVDNDIKGSVNNSTDLIQRRWHEREKLIKINDGKTFLEDVRNRAGSIDKDGNIKISDNEIFLRSYGSDDDNDNIVRRNYEFNKAKFSKGAYVNHNSEKFLNSKKHYFERNNNYVAKYVRRIKRDINYDDPNISSGTETFPKNLHISRHDSKGIINDEVKGMRRRQSEMNTINLRDDDKDADRASTDDKINLNGFINDLAEGDIAPTKDIRRSKREMNMSNRNVTNGKIFLKGVDTSGNGFNKDNSRKAYDIVDDLGSKKRGVITDPIDTDNGDDDEDDPDSDVSYYIIYTGDDDKLDIDKNTHHRSIEVDSKSTQLTNSRMDAPKHRNGGEENKALSYLPHPILHKTVEALRNNEGNVSIPQPLQINSTVIAKNKISTDPSLDGKANSSQINLDVSSQVAKENKLNLAMHYFGHHILSDIQSRLNETHIIRENSERTYDKHENLSAERSKLNASGHNWQNVSTEFIRNRSAHEHSGGEDTNTTQSNKLGLNATNLNWKNIEVPSQFVNQSNLKAINVSTENLKMSSKYSQENYTEYNKRNDVNVKPRTLSYDQSKITRYYHSSYNSHIIIGNNQSKFIKNGTVADNMNVYNSSRLLASHTSNLKNQNLSSRENIKGNSPVVDDHATRHLNLSDVDHPTSNIEHSNNEEINRRSRGIGEWIVGKSYLPSSVKLDNHRSTNTPALHSRNDRQNHRPVRQFGDFFTGSSAKAHNHYQPDRHRPQNFQSEGISYTDADSVIDDYEPNTQQSYESYNQKRNQNHHKRKINYDDSYFPERDEEDYDQIAENSHKPYSYKSSNHFETHIPEHYYFKLGDHQHKSGHRHKPETDFESFDFSKLKSYFSKSRDNPRMPFSTEPVVQTFHFHDGDDDSRVDGSSIRVEKIGDKKELEKYHPAAIIIINTGGKMNDEKKGDEYGSDHPRIHQFGTGHGQKHEHGSGYEHHHHPPMHEHGSGYEHMREHEHLPRKHSRPKRVYMRKVPSGKINFFLKKIIRRKY